MSHSERSSASGPKHSTGVLITVGILLAAPIVALMWVGSYNVDSPRLWGFPFFYWYQFLWVLIAAGATYGAFRLLAWSERRSQRNEDAR
jgi:membrane protein implicated in regulation of membrane protease activity